MKKIITLLIGTMAATLLSPLVLAVPGFSRQTGFACKACHFQSFPALNEFGRAFKSGGFTMVGAQAKVESDRLSIPENLNWGVLSTTSIENVSNPDGVNVFDSINTPAGGGELSLIYGGRITANIGFLAALGAAGSAATAAAKLPILYEVADGIRAGMVIITTDGEGAAYSFETLNTGALGMQRIVPTPGVNANAAHLRAYSAAQYLGTNTGAQGASFVVNNDHYFINLGKYAVISQLGQPTRGGSLGMTYARAAGMVEVAGFDSAIGVQVFRGDDAGLPIPASGVAGIKMATEATIVDGQMQGKVGTMPLGVYLSIGLAPAVADTNFGGNLFNPGNKVTARSTNLAAQLGVVPGVATVIAAVRQGHSGGVDANGDALTDNAVMAVATYNLAENVVTSLSYTVQSGTAWVTVAGVEPVGKTVTTLMLQALF